MIHNSTIDTQLNHKSIRKFKDITLNHEQLETLYTVFSRTATSMFMQNASLLHITDEAKKQKIQELCGQKYVGAEGDLFIFIVDLYRNQQIRKQLNKDDVEYIQPIFSSKQWKIHCLLFKMWLMPLKAWI